MNPEQVPERMEELLSLILQREVKILQVLPNECGGIAVEGSLLIMDIIVELTDGSIANVEVQKIGYNFPAQRASCYSSDMLLRQYKRVRGEKGKTFNYQDIKKVYTIVLLEQSTSIFHKFPMDYIHRGRTVFDTGLPLDMLQEFVFISLDIFCKIQQNGGVSKRDRLEAWLTFLSVDEPEEILQLLEEYPDFEPLYEEVYRMCRNMEGIMGWYSEELAELDRNTVQYMIDELQEQLDLKDEQLNQKDEQLNQKDEEIRKLKELLGQAGL